MKIFNENGEELHIGDIISRISPNVLDKIVSDLDKYALIYDSYEYGLPDHKEGPNEMRQIVRNALNIHDFKSEKNVPTCPNCKGRHCIEHTKHCTKCNSTFWTTVNRHK